MVVSLHALVLKGSSFLSCTNRSMVSCFLDAELAIEQLLLQFCY